MTEWSEILVTNVTMLTNVISLEQRKSDRCRYILILVIRVFVMYKLNIRPISFSTSLYSKRF